MIIVKFFGVLDILVAVLLFLTPDKAAPTRLLLGAALYLILKGIMFKGDVLSMIDLGIGSYALLAIVFPITVLSFITGIYIFLKGFYSVVV